MAAHVASFVFVWAFLFGLLGSVICLSVPRAERLPWHATLVFYLLAVSGIAALTLLLMNA